MVARKRRGQPKRKKVKLLSRATQKKKSGPSGCKRQFLRGEQRGTPLRERKLQKHEWLEKKRFGKMSLQGQIAGHLKHCSQKKVLTKRSRPMLSLPSTKTFPVMSKRKVYEIRLACLRLPQPEKRSKKSRGDCLDLVRKKLRV